METVLACAICESSSLRQVDTECNLCVCKSCGFVFDSPRPTLQELVEFYSADTKYDSWLEDEKARDALWRRRLHKMLPHTHGGSILDVGSGIGQFLHHAKPYFTEICGTEISASGLAIAKSKYGIELLHGALEEIDLPAESFDTITLFHVLEHVPSPRKLLERCRYLLRENGIMVIAVPNEVLAWTSRIKQMGRRIGLRPFRKFSPCFGIPKACTSSEVHLSHFTPHLLSNLLGRVGFSVIEESLDPYYAYHGLKQGVHVSYYAVHHLLWRLLKFNAYDTIWMVARKTDASRS